MTFVTPDHIRKTMEKHQRCIFYVYDDKRELLHACEDCDSPAAAYSELEDYIEGCIGSHVIVELPAVAKGKGARGGNRNTTDEAVFKFKVKLQSGQRGNDGGLSGSGSLPMIMRLMEQQQELNIRLAKQEHEFKLKELERDMKELKKNKGEGGLDRFADIMWNKYTEAERVKDIAKEVTAKHAPAPAAAEPAATINDEVNPQKEKLKSAIAGFREVDSNYIDNMAFLADYAKKNPAIYKEFIEGLKGGAK